LNLLYDQNGQEDKRIDDEEAKQIGDNGNHALSLALPAGESAQEIAAKPAH